MYWTCNSLNNLSSYCGLVDAKIRASDKDLPVPPSYFRSRVMTPMRNPLLKMGTKKPLTIGMMKMKREEKNFLKKNLTIITKKMFTNPQDQWFLCQKCSGWFQWFGLKNKMIVIVNHTTISTLSSFLQVSCDKFLFSIINHEIFFLGLENSLLWIRVTK